MAEKRMFTKKITESDAFLNMPLSTQALYFHLNMAADDEGFVNSPKKIQRMIGASDDDFKLLLAKNFVIWFESGVIVIKHWKMHNCIQRDRFHATDYQDERGLLEVKENGAYTLSVYEMDTTCIQNGNADKNRLEENRIDKNRIDNNMSGKPDTGLKENYIDQIKYIIGYLNKKSGKNFKDTTDATNRLIRARIREGYKVSDFEKVIDTKCAEWLGTEQALYIRPETLFAPKHFESYLNQQAVTVKSATERLKDL